MAPSLLRTDDVYGAVGGCISVDYLPPQSNPGRLYRYFPTTTTLIATTTLTPISGITAVAISQFIRRDQVKVAAVRHTNILPDHNRCNHTSLTMAWLCYGT
jgi:hypothetical protein